MNFGIEDFRCDRIPGARERIAPHIQRTELRRSPALSRETGADVLLKLECAQITGSFKARGALAAVTALGAETAGGGVVTCSTGNHGQALAWAAGIAGISCTVVVPRGVAPVKEALIRSRGARVIHAPHDAYDLTQVWTLANLGDLGGTFVSPFEHPEVVAGNGGTTGMEILEDAPGAEVIITPCGGGGLAAGLGQALELAGSGAELVGVNSTASPGMWLSRRDGRAHLQIESDPTLADGIEGGVGEITFALGNRYLRDVVVVEETEIAEAVSWIQVHENLVIEGSAATAVAALRRGKFSGRRVVLVLTGRNIDPDLHARLIS